MAHKNQPRAFMHGEDPLVVCPFDKNHKVKESRLDIHISRAHKDRRPSFGNSSNHTAPASTLQEAHASRPHRESASSRAESAAASAAEADALYPVRPVEGMPEPEESWDADGDDLDSWPQPQREPVFRPVPIGARPADRRAFYGDLKSAPPPTWPVRVLQSSGGSQRSSTGSTLQAAADKLYALQDTAQPSASSSRLPPPLQPWRAELREYAQPKSTVRKRQAVKLPLHRLGAESDSDDDPDVLACRMAALGIERRRAE